MQFEPIIESRLNKKILRFSPLAGGDINEVYRITTQNKEYVVKINMESRYPEMFQKEGKGLELLSKTGVHTPKTIAWFSDSGYQFLVLEYLEETRPDEFFWKKFASDLAKIHRYENPFFGLEYDNYIGSLKQRNTREEKWSDFFIRQRIQPLTKLAFDNNLLNVNHLIAFDRFFKRLEALVPEEKPALLHGDLWSGNLMCAEQNTPVFIDPAVYFGHREMDIAMTQLFGGFNAKYLIYYNEVYPLEKDWEQRMDIHNLYPNLVHLNLFGRAYLGSIERVINRF